MPRLIAVCSVHALRPDAGAVGVTAIDKRPIDGPVRIGPYGVYADVQASRKHHGGLDKAVYAYAQEDAEYWEGELGRPLDPGFFGENLRTTGMDVNAARIGERWRVGETVVLEVTMPRTPCQTFARWVGGADERGWVKRFADAQRLGPYLRVVKSGPVRAGDPIDVLAAEPGAPTIIDVFRGP
ncbi:MOSC domain-containing protein [Microbacterium sp. Sa4CUA7]|uniref:MOSC domain-containing protein n=1 Tax=Microbacterium pullorum TaxID=2762236 RepID=A0ABR8S072_9MICO|nr:MOSC domain-containing protein [Microbacterium pullorum]MBD7956853.1 MOSC domain-containing protein [Microbacterium pullorum]